MDSGFIHNVKKITFGPVIVNHSETSGYYANAKLIIETDRGSFTLDMFAKNPESLVANVIKGE
jgi:hypothetical protein